VKAGDDRKRIWKENYDKLRAAGFSVKDAARLNKSIEKTNIAITTGQIPEKNEQQQKAGLAGTQARREKSEKYQNKLIQELKKSPELKPEKIKEKAVKTKPLKKENLDNINSIINRWYKNTEDFNVIYYSRFTYVIEFDRVDKTTDFISITSSRMMNAAEVKNVAKQILVEAYYNPGKLPGKPRRGGSDPNRAMPLFNTIRICDRFYNPNAGGK